MNDTLAPLVLFDTLIVGSGPAGLSAAIYLARACRSVLVFDCDQPGRSNWAQVNHNYLGFPEGISIQELRQRGRRQAERFGVQFCDEMVTGLERCGELFAAQTSHRIVRGRTVILATGVTDSWPDFPGHEACIGRSLHWCIVCDGFEMQEQRVIVIGDDTGAVELAIQLRAFAREVTLLTGATTDGLQPDAAGELQSLGVRCISGRIEHVQERQTGMVQSLLLDSGEMIDVDHIFSALGAVPNSDLAASLGVTLNDDGYITVDTNARTNVRGVFAAGDVTRLFSHQVGTAVHEGGTAAGALDYFLYEQDHAAPRARCVTNRDLAPE